MIEMAEFRVPGLMCLSSGTFLITVWCDDDRNCFLSFILCKFNAKKTNLHRL